MQQNKRWEWKLSNLCPVRCSVQGVSELDYDAVLALRQRGFMPTLRVYFAAIPLGKGFTVHYHIYLAFSDGT